MQLVVYSYVHVEPFLSSLDDMKLKARVLPRIINAIAAFEES